MRFLLGVWRKRSPPKVPKPAMVVAVRFRREAICWASPLRLPSEAISVQMLFDESSVSYSSLWFMGIVIIVEFITSGDYIKLSRNSFSPSLLFSRFTKRYVIHLRTVIRLAASSGEKEKGHAVVLCSLKSRTGLRSASGAYILIGSIHSPFVIFRRVAGSDVLYEMKMMNPWRISPGKKPVVLIDT